MKRSSRCTLVLAFLLAQAASSALGENWPQWRGPFLNGSTTETGLPTVFDKTKNVAWVIPMPGQSGATPIVWGDRVFISSADEKTRRLLAICIDAKSGKVLWKKDTGRDRRVGRNNMASPSPIADGKTVYFYYGTAGLFAFDFAGKLLWERDLEKDHGHNALMWGYSSSPLLYKGKLYIIAIRNKRQDRYRLAPPGRSESYLLAIDPKTGKDLWRVPRPADAVDEAQEAYSTVMPYEHDGRSEVLVYGADDLTGHDSETGKELWRWATYNPRKIRHWRIVPSPVVVGELVFVFGPKHSRMFAIRPDGKGRLGKSHVVWTFDRLIPDASTALVYRGRLYVLDDDNKVMTCFEPKTGKKKWQLKLRTRHVMRPSPTGADGKIYCMDDVGDVFVLAAGDEPKLLHRTSMGRRRFSRSTIVAAQGKLFIRTTESLYCIGQARPDAN